MKDHKKPSVEGALGSCNNDGFDWRDQSCPICTDAQARFLGRRGGEAHRLGLGVVSSIFQCRGCGLIYPCPMPIPSTISEHYGDADKYFAEHSIDGKFAAYDSVIRTIEELGAKPGRLLDIGAGRGELLRAARSRGWEAVGLEPSPGFAGFARKYSGAEVVEGRIEERLFQERSFDVVTLGAVLEHVFNPVELLSEINRVLREGGMFWLDVPNEAGLFFRLGNLYHRLRRRDWVVNLSPTFPPYHVFGYTPVALRRLLDFAGFDVVHLQTYATPAVLETSTSPVPAKLRPLLGLALRVGERMGAGTYMDAWCRKR